MTPKRAWGLLGACVVCVELGFIVTHPDWSKAVFRACYEWGFDRIWPILPHPPGVTEHPHRFQ